MSRFILPVLRGLLICLLLPIIGFACALAATGGNDSPLAVPPALFVATIFLSSLAGAATLSLRIMAELKANADAGQPSKPLLHPWIYCITHMLGSWAAGAFGFVISMQQQAGAWWLLGTVLALSFGGAKACERIADSWSLKAKP